MGVFPFSFHAGPGGNRNGLGDYFTDLDAAGLPANIKCSDDYGACHELVQLKRASGVNHTITFRLSTAGQNDGFDYDTPQYHLDPAVAASIHWQYTVSKLPSEFSKEHVWLEVINEPDKERADWLGEFGQEIYWLAQDDGYKVALFGWSTGTPEPEAWEEPGMAAFLALAADNPDNLAVALHEYSLTVQDIMDGYPYLVGRFTFLYSACQNLGIGRPTTLITEWGWEYNDAPNKDAAMADILAVADIYTQYPEILQASTWCLNGGWSGLADKIQPLIDPVRREALTYEPPEQPPGDVDGLVNAGFEEPHAGNHSALEIMPDGTINEVTVGNIATPPGWGTYFYHNGEDPAQPEVKAATHLFPPRMRTGLQGDLFFTFWRTHKGGHYQYKNVKVGDLVMAGIYAHAWSNHEDASKPDEFPHPDDPYWSEGAGYGPFFALDSDPGLNDAQRNFTFTVGIDPYGGSDPQSPNVVWGQGAHIYNEYAMVPPAVAEARAETVTIFIQSETLWAFKHNDAYWDDAWVTVESEPEPEPGETLEQYFWRRSQERQIECGISLNSEALLQSVLFDLDLTPVVSEEWEYFEDVQYAYMAGESVPGADPRRVAIAEVPGPGDPWIATSFTDPGDGQPPDPDPDPDTLVLTNFPTDYLFITQLFGVNPEDYAQYGLPGHNGYDIMAPLDARIYAAVSGTVVWASNRQYSNPALDSDYGWHLRIETDTAEGTYTIIYGHLDQQLLVAVGDTVNGGRLLGYSGNTGNSSGPHLHFEMRLCPGDPGWPWCIIDPTAWLEPFLDTAPSPTIDMLRYFQVVDSGIGPFYVLQHTGGTTENIQHQIEFNDVYIVKNSQYEHLRVTTAYVERDEDTSPGNGLYYRLDDGNGWSKWCPRFWKKGDSYFRQPDVRFYLKDGCVLQSEVHDVGSYLRFENFEEIWTSPASNASPNGITLNNVVHLVFSWAANGDPIEEYWFAEGIGLVQWKNNQGAHSWISELPSGRDPLNREVINCL